MWLGFLSGGRTGLALLPPAPAIKTFRGSQHQGILASVRCNNLVTTLMFDITGDWGCFGVWMHMCRGLEVCFSSLFFLWGS